MKKMKSALISFAFLFVCFCSHAQVVQFQRTYSMPGNDVGHAIPTLDSGYVIYGGSNVITSSESPFLIKTDKYGDVVWEKEIIISNTTVVTTRNIVQTADSCYVLLATALGNYGMAFGVKTDVNGNTLWYKRIEAVHCLRNTFDGGFILSGANNLEKRDSQFNLEWSTVFGGQSDNGSPSYVIQTADSGFLSYGTTQSFSTSGPPDVDIFLVKTDKNGVVLWTKIYGTTNGESARDVKQTQDGGFIICGQFIGFNNSHDILLIKTDAVGNIQWNKIYGESYDDYALFVEELDEFHAGYLVGGQTQGIEGTYFQSMKSYLIQVDFFGNLDWAKMYGEMITTSPYNDLFFHLHKSSDGGYIISGYTAGLAFNQSSWDTWLIKTDSNGVSGCNEFPVFPTVSTPTLGVTSANNIQTWAPVTGTAPFTTNNISSNPIILCTNHIITSNNETPNTTNEFLIYPNPATTQVTLQPQQPFKNAAVIIYNTLGAMVMQHQNIKGEKITIETNELPAGIYFITVLDEDKTYTSKLIIE